MSLEKDWEELQIKDDFLFSKVMRDKDICIKLLEKLLKIKIDDIVYLEEQKTIDIGYDAKSVRLDVFVDDGKRIFNLEMQTTNRKELPRRSRYYQGMIDLNTIEKGESYKKLKESFVIFICTFDPFGEGRPQYTFENICLEDNTLKLNDGAKKIFFNTADYMKEENEDIREFLGYVNGSKSNNSFVKELENKVTAVKSNKEWRQEYMTLRMREEEIRDDTIKKVVEKLLRKGMDIEFIMETTDLTKEEVLEIEEALLVSN